MKIFTRHAVATVAVFLLIGCQSTPSIQPATQAKITGFTPFGVAGGYDVGSLIDYSNQNYKTLFTSEYIERNARPEAQKGLNTLFHTPLQAVSPRYNDNQKRQFMEAIKRTLLAGRFNLSDRAKAAIDKIVKIDIAVASAAKKSAAAPEALQYRLIEALPPTGGVIIGIKAKTGMAKTAVAVTSILIFKRATVTLYFDRSVGTAERIEIFDKSYFDNRVVIKLGSQTENSLRIEYTQPTVVAFKGFRFDKQALRFYIKNGRLPSAKESLALTSAQQPLARATTATSKKRSVNDSDMYDVPWGP